MKQSEYLKILKSLRNWGDVEALQQSYPLEILRAILAQKMVRDVRSNFYCYKAKAKKLSLEWERGSSFVKIAEEMSFSPIMTAQIILEERGMKKGEFREILKNPSVSVDARIKSEIAEALNKDLIYSPEAMSRQALHGKQGEALLLQWLQKKGIKFKTEKEILHESKKTPDFLLENPIPLRGIQIHWIESKASFGDEHQIKRDHSRQLQHYAKHFGNGAVVYWLGFIEDLKFVQDSKHILFLDENFFK